MKLGTAYFGNRILKHVRSDMKELATMGFDQVIHTFSENDQVFYKDTIRDIVSMTKDAGMEAWIDPWGVGRIFGGEAFSLFVEINSPDGCQVLSDGKPAGNACPNSPKFRDFMKKWVEDAAYTGAETVLWDEPHFHLPAWIGGRPGQWGCRCQVCQRLYEEQEGAPMPMEETPQVKAFKDRCLHQFLADFAKVAAEAGLKNALCVLPHVTPDRVFEDWLPLAKIEHLDIFGTDPYWILNKQPVEMVGEYSRELQRLCDHVGVESQVWIQGFRIPAGREEETGVAVEQAASARPDNLAVWGYEACANISWIRPADPERCWSIITSKMLASKRRGG